MGFEWSNPDCIYTEIRQEALEVRNKATELLYRALWTYEMDILAQLIYLDNPSAQEIQKFLKLAPAVFSQPIGISADFSDLTALMSKATHYMLYYFYFQQALERASDSEQQAFNDEINHILTPRSFGHLPVFSEAILAAEKLGKEQLVKLLIQKQADLCERGRQTEERDGILNFLPRIAKVITQKEKEQEARGIPLSKPEVVKRTKPIQGELDEFKSQYRQLCIKIWSYRILRKLIQHSDLKGLQSALANKECASAMSRDFLSDQFYSQTPESVKVKQFVISFFKKKDKAETNNPTTLLHRIFSVSKPSQGQKNTMSAQT